MEENRRLGTKEEQEVLDKLMKNYRGLSEDEFNYAILTSPNKDFELLLQRIDNQIDLVNSHPDSKKRYEIATNFFKKLYSDNLFETYYEIKSASDFINVKKVLQGGDYLKTIREFDNLKGEQDAKRLCELYAFSYERACRLYFKPLAQTITKKKIENCGQCIQKIIEYYPDMEFVLYPFINKIRNSISHAGYYYDPKKELIVFEDQDEEKIELTIENLKALCMFEVASDLGISTADQALKLPISKAAQYYYGKIEEYCKLLQIDFNEVVVNWASQGYKLVGLYVVLESLMQARKFNKLFDSNEENKQEN